MSYSVNTEFLQESVKLCIINCTMKPCNNRNYGITENILNKLLFILIENSLKIKCLWCNLGCQPTTIIPKVKCG